MQETLVQSQCDQKDLPGGGPGNPLQYSCLENPMDRGAWRFRVRVGHDESNWSHTHPHKPTQTSVSSQAWPHPFPSCVYTAALLEFLFQLPGCTMLLPSGQESQCPTPTTPPLHLRSLLFICRSKGHFFKLSPVPLLHMSCYKASFPSSPFSVYTLTFMMNECLSPPLSRRPREDRNPLLALPITAGPEGALHRYLLDKRRLLAVKGKREGWYIKAFTKSMRKSKQVFQAKHSFSYVLSFE